MIMYIVQILFSFASSSTCPASSFNSNTIVVEQGGYLGKTAAYIYNTEVGDISGSLYQMYYTYNPVHAVVRKMSYTGILMWMTSISFSPRPKSLTIDSNENQVYFINDKVPLEVCILNAATGTIINGQIIPLDGQTDDIRIHVLSDNSGYYIISQDTSFIVNICKHLFSSPTTCQCQQIPNFKTFSFGQLQISDIAIFMLGYDPSSYALHLYLLTFGNLSPDWSRKMLCPSST